MSFRPDLVVSLLLATAILGTGSLPAQPPAEPAGSGPGLEWELGRNEVRVLSAPYRIAPGLTVRTAALPERLERLGYRRVHRRPEVPGEYFWGYEVFWIYRPRHRVGGSLLPPRLFGLELDRQSGRILGFVDAAGEPLWEGGGGRPWLEPELLAESLAPDRTPREPVELGELPEHVWRAVLAAEDHRFFDHAGVDAVAVARALLANVLAGEVTQGGSTLTQQLVKVRDLTPKRTLGRKVSEAVRALALEAEHDKREILESYLDHVYMGHVRGLGVYGVGAAARTYYSKRASELDLGEAAALAALIQSPNRRSPVRHPERLAGRWRWVLSRIEELGWAEPEAVARELLRGLPAVRLDPPEPPPARRFLGWVRRVVEDEAPRRLEEGRGVVVQTGIDPLLQARAERSLAAGLARLEAGNPALRRRPLAAALVALDARNGGVLAHVGGDPRDRRDAFDRVRSAERQTGSALKPLVLLEAFDDCGPHEPLYPAARVLDEPVTVPLPSGPWRPENFRRRYRGTVDLRESLVVSLNVPFVRVARHCGFGEVAETFRRAGLRLPEEPPPAFVLGAVEQTPAALAGAFTTFATLGVVLEPLPLRSLHRPSGSRIAAWDRDGRRIAEPAAAFLVLDLLRDAVRRGTGRAANVAPLEELGAWGKSGSSSGFRDAWFVGGAGSVVTALWVGMDDGTPLGISSLEAAVPLWADFMAEAAPARPRLDLVPPDDVVVLWVQDRTGRLVERPRRDSHSDLFDRDHLPPGRRWYRPDPPLEVIE